MTPEQELAERLKEWGYSDIEIMPGEESVLMLYVGGHLICSVNHALSLPDDDLKALIY